MSQYTDTRGLKLQLDDIRCIRYKNFGKRVNSTIQSVSGHGNRSYKNQQSEFLNTQSDVAPRYPSTAMSRGYYSKKFKNQQNREIVNNVYSPENVPQADGEENEDKQSTESNQLSDPKIFQEHQDKNHNASRKVRPVTTQNQNKMRTMYLQGEQKQSSPKKKGYKNCDDLYQYQLQKYLNTNFINNQKNKGQLRNVLKNNANQSTISGQLQSEVDFISQNPQQRSMSQIGKIKPIMRQRRTSRNQFNNNNRTIQHSEQIRNDLDDISDQYSKQTLNSTVPLKRYMRETVNSKIMKIEKQIERKEVEDQSGGLAAGIISNYVASPITSPQNDNQSIGFSAFAISNKPSVQGIPYDKYSEQIANMPSQKIVPKPQVQKNKNNSVIRSPSSNGSYNTTIQIYMKKRGQRAKSAYRSPTVGLDTRPSFLDQINDIKDIEQLFQDKQLKEQIYGRMKRNGINNTIQMDAKRPSATDNMYQNGIQSNFTSTFMNIMYRDHSLFSASRKKIQIPSANKIVESRQIDNLEKTEARHRKQQIVKIFKAKFNIKMVNEKNLDFYSEEQLFINLRLKQIKQIEHYAAIVIQKFARMMFKRLWWIKTRKIRYAAALMIQNNFRQYRRWKIIPKLLRARKNQSATCIQKYMRGYYVSKHCFNQIQQSKMEHNYEYFEDLKRRLEDNAGRLIKIYYLKYRMNKAAKMEQELIVQEKQRLKDKKNKNTKFKKSSVKQKDVQSDQKFRQQAQEIKHKKLSFQMKYASAVLKYVAQKSLFKNLDDYEEYQNQNYYKNAGQRQSIVNKQNIKREYETMLPNKIQNASKGVTALGNPKLQKKFTVETQNEPSSPQKLRMTKTLKAGGGIKPVQESSETTDNPFQKAPEIDNPQTILQSIDGSQGFNIKVVETPQLKASINEDFDTVTPEGEQLSRNFQTNVKISSLPRSTVGDIENLDVDSVENVREPTQSITTMQNENQSPSHTTMSPSPNKATTPSEID